MPSCANCKTYGRDCVYQPLSDADRAEERRKRQNRLSHATSPSSRPPPGPRADDDFLDGVSNPSQMDLVASPDSAEDSVRTGQHGVSRIVVSANGVPSYHGQTSALFEENLQDRPPDVRPKMPDEWVEKGLVAEDSVSMVDRCFNFISSIDMMKAIWKSSITGRKSSISTTSSRIWVCTCSSSIGTASIIHF